VNCATRAAFRRRSASALTPTRPLRSLPRTRTSQSTGRLAGSPCCGRWPA